MVGGHAKTAFLHAAISAATHQRQRRHGLKKKSATFLRLRRILENTVRLSKILSIYTYKSITHAPRYSSIAYMNIVSHMATYVWYESRWSTPI
jgi:hypothetical protein